MVLYNIFNEGSEQVLLGEATKLMTMTSNEEAREMGKRDFEYATTEIPTMSARIQVLKIPGMGTSQYTDWDWSDGNNKNAFGLEVSRPRVKQVQRLFEISNRRDTIATF